jgi:hypothetical protein
MGEQKISYSKLVGHFQHDLFIILDKWKVNFGTDLERTWNNTKTGNMSQPHHTPEPIKDLVETAKHRLNEASRVGEASLFLRDPREDRLVLFYSTSENLLKGNADSKQVRDRANYFDSSQGCYYYPLYDRLADAQDRESEHSKIARGLTGWVAVAGHYLIVNGEYGNQGLISLSEDRPETLGACQRYGIPIWGRHIAEAPSDPNRPKRFIAVPIQSCADTKKTIGVLRYACPCSGRELSESDLVFLQIISAEHIILVPSWTFWQIRFAQISPLYILMWEALLIQNPGYDCWTLTVLKHPWLVSGLQTKYKIICRERVALLVGFMTARQKNPL